MDVLTLVLVLVAAVVLLGAAAKAVTSIVIYEWEVGLLYLNGRFRRELPPGRHRVAALFRKVHVARVATNEQYYHLGLNDVTSADGLPFRMAAVIRYRVVDPRRHHENDPHLAVNAAAGVALAELASKHELAAMQKNRAAHNVELANFLGSPSPTIELIEVTISQLVLPPETRRLFVEVEKARLEGLAALERARGEQASLRALANAARLLKDNPALTNLRLLQAVQSSKGSATLILGQGALVPANEMKS